MDWIAAASAAGALNEPGRIAAGKIKDAGDDDVHAAPGLAPDGEDILRNLTLVLEQIEDFPRTPE